MDQLVVPACILLAIVVIFVLVNFDPYDDDTNIGDH